MSKASDGALSAIGKVITYLLVVLLVLGIAGMVAYFALRGQGVTFYVEYNGERYFANGDGGSLWLPPSTEPKTFSVKSLTGGEVNYDVKVTSNEANNLLFVVGNELHYLYSGDEEKDDYTEVFGVQKQKDGFSLTVPDNFSVKQAIETKYGGDIELQSELQDDLCYFIVTVASDKSVVNLWFNFSDFTITLEPSEIVF